MKLQIFLLTLFVIAVSSPPAAGAEDFLRVVAVQGDKFIACDDNQQCWYMQVFNGQVPRTHEVVAIPGTWQGSQPAVPRDNVGAVVYGTESCYNVILWVAGKVYR